MMATHIGSDSSTAKASAADKLQMPRERLALEEFERAERRRTAQDEMQSDYRSATEKIGAWERLHGLQLPRDPNHVILRVVAGRTGLSMEAVIEEQSRRAVRQAGSVTSAP
jgi:hypothetical protein